MFLGNTLGSAASGLDSISRQLALVSQNVANASTPNYVRQTLTVTSAAAGDQNFGVRTGPAIRNTDDVLHTELLQAVGSEKKGAGQAGGIGAHRPSLGRAGRHAGLAVAAGRPA